MAAASVWLIAAGWRDGLAIGGIAALVLCGVVLAIVLIRYGGLWFQAFVSGADVAVLSLIGMSFRQIKPGPIVTAKVMARQAGLSIDRRTGMSTARLEAHVLAGGDLMNVVRAIIAAQRADIDLDFDRAAAIDLAGRDVFDAVQTSVLPKVIECPPAAAGARSMISAIAKNGVELKIRALVTVRTNLQQLIGGATEETIIARVGQGIITSVGSSETHMEVMGMPDRISKSVLAAGLDVNTAFEIVSIDIADIDIGQNIGARLQSDQAEADMRVAQARAEQRRVEAVAQEQEMRARVTAGRAQRVLAQAEVPSAIAAAFRRGALHRPRPSSSAVQAAREGHAARAN